MNTNSSGCDRVACTVVTNLVLAFLFLGEEDGVDVRKDSSLGDGDVSKELVQLFVVSDGELNVSWSDTSSLVVLGGVSGEFQKFRGEVLEDGGEVDRGSGTDSLGETSLTEVSSHAADRELKPRPGRSCGGSFLSHDGFLGLELGDS